MNRPLAGLTAVVARPAPQAVSFSAALRAAGAEVIAIPALLIEPLPFDADQLRRIRHHICDWMIFTSANAVEHYPGELPPACRPRIAAVGRATALALAARGLEVSALPEVRYDSEGLLALPQFAEPVHARVLIVRGEGGRELLRTELVKRGATVDVAEVYSRRRASADPQSVARLEQALKSGARIITAITSVEVLEGLLEQLPGRCRERLRETTLVAPGGRVATAAAARGWTGPLRIAESAEDAAMLQAILDVAGS